MHLIFCGISHICTLAWLSSIITDVGPVTIRFS